MICEKLKIQIGSPLSFRRAAPRGVRARAMTMRMIQDRRARHKHDEKNLTFFKKKACTLVLLGYYRLTGKVS